LGPPPPVLEVYYSPACAPCQLELPSIVEFIRLDGGRVRILILDQARRARDELQGASPALAAVAVVATVPNERAVLRAGGDADGLLPYARAIASDGKVCSSWRGDLTLERARMLVNACLNAPNKRRS